MPQLKGAKERRARRRLARVRLANPKALPRVTTENGLNRREGRKIRRAATKLRKREATKKTSTKPKTGGFDPLAPLTGPALKKETKAAQRLEFGGRTQELKNAIAGHEQETANTGSYYDQYKQALAAANAATQAAHTQAVGQTQAQVDKGYTEDKAAVEARNKAATAQAKPFGIQPATSEEGARAVEAQRSQGNQQTGAMRTQAASDVKLHEGLGATSVLAKAEALGRRARERGELRKEQSNLAKEKGAFRTNFRTKARESEREWSAIQKEFGLQKQELKQKAGTSRADRRLEQQKIAAQKIVAQIYAGADRAGARAQIRVAKLQLKKGKISQRQYREIVNIYRGLPEKGKSGGAAAPGAKPKLQTWERDKVSHAVTILSKQKAKPAEKAEWLRRMQGEGVPLRLARRAWARYIKSYGVDLPNNLPSYPTPED